MYIPIVVILVSFLYPLPKIYRFHYIFMHIGVLSLILWWCDLQSQLKVIVTYFVVKYYFHQLFLFSWLRFSQKTIKFVLLLTIFYNFCHSNLSFRFDIYSINFHSQIISNQAGWFPLMVTLIIILNLGHFSTLVRYDSRLKCTRNGIWWAGSQNLHIETICICNWTIISFN